MRVLVTMLATTLAAVCLAAPLCLLGPLAPESQAGETKADKRPHRLYDDRGALDWAKTMADAKTAAKDARKLIFIEFGRES